MRNHYQVYEKEENNKVMINILSSVVGTYNKESREHILHIRIATQMLLRRLVEKTDAYPLTVRCQSQKKF